MMKYFVLLFLVVSCAQKQNINKVKVTDKDFDLTVKVKYSRSHDHFPSVNLRDADSLRTQSLGHLSSRDKYLFDLPKQPLVQSLSYCYLKDFGTAKNISKKIYKSEKGNPVYWNQVGTCYLLKKEYEKALLYYQTAIHFYSKAARTNKTYIPVENNIGVLHALHGDYYKAIDQFKTVLKRHSKNRIARYNLAQIYIQFGIIEKAGPILTDLHNIDENDQDVLATLAFCKLARSNFNDALKLYERLSKKRRKDPNVGIGYSYALYKTNHLEKAFKAFKGVKSPKDKKLKPFYISVKKVMTLEENKFEKAKKLKKAKKKS